MAAMKLPTTTPRPRSLFHETFCQTIWLCGVGFQIYLAIAIVEETSVHTNSAFISSVCGSDMTNLCKRYTIIAGVSAVLVYFAILMTVTGGLENSFYWAWGNKWKESWFGRAAYWMWGPIERDDEVESMEKGLAREKGWEEVMNVFREMGLTSEGKLIPM
jgi:hypothetical protein